MKPAIKAFAIAAIASSFLIPGVQIASTFDPARLRLVDSHEHPSGGTSLLVRGNSPLDGDGKFDPRMVLGAIRRKLVPRMDLDGHGLVVVSLVSGTSSDERRVLEEERRYVWGEEGDESELSARPMGAVLHCPLVGSYAAPSPLPQDVFLFNRAVWWLLSPDDGTWDLAGELRRLLLREGTDGTPVDVVTGKVGNLPLVIYVHCMRGIDRTGLAAGTYLARYRKFTAQEVERTNWDVGKREVNWPARNALRWTLWLAHHEDNDAGAH